MTTVYERAASALPGTHVLAIGVGKYPHLLGGTGPLANNPLGLGQLTSPPLSLKRFVDWCLAPLMPVPTVGFINADCGLASIEAVASAESAVTISTPLGEQVLGPATRQEIQNAFAVWLGRVKSVQGNTGVFYFCGHGIIVSDHYLLAEDFGQNNLTIFDRGFDLSNTIRAVERETNGALYFFVDACRQVSKKKAMTLGATPNALMALDLDKPVTRETTVHIKATGEGKLAFAVEGKVSRFTEGLVTALSGYCGIKVAGSASWDVDGETLAFAVRKLLEKGNKTAKRKQVSDQEIGGSSVPLLRLTKAPKVKVAVDLSPEQMRAMAKMYLQSAKGTLYEHDGANGAFMTEVPRGMYDIGAKAGANEFAALLLADEDLIPPLYDVMMKAGL
jgi:Caspase domain